MLKIAILIPVYNKINYTKHCLEDLQQRTNNINKDNVEIVVIDDGSSDGTTEWIHNNYKEVTVLHGNGNLFWSGAINLGLKYAINQKGFDYVLFWNNDIIVADDYFENLIKLIENQNITGIVGSKIITLYDKSIIWGYGGYFFPKNGKKGMYGYFEEDKEEFLQKREVDWVTGMGALVSRHVVEKIGLCDNKRFPQYFGDMDFSYRAKLAGFKVIVSPELVIYNDTSNTGMRAQNGMSSLLKSLFNKKSNLCIQSNFGFLRKHKSHLKAYVRMSLFYLKVLGGYLKWKILSVAGLRRENEKYYND